MNKFVVPDVPTIFVPVINNENTRKPERKKSSQFDHNKVPTKVTKNIPKAEVNSNKKCETKTTDLLCNDCSQVLVNYLKPVQQYINKVMEIVELGKVEENIKQDDSLKMIEKLVTIQPNIENKILAQPSILSNTVSQPSIVNKLVSTDHISASHSDNVKEIPQLITREPYQKNESAVNSNTFYVDGEKPSLEVEDIGEKFNLEMNKEDNLSIVDIPSYQCKHDEVLNQGLKNELESNNLVCNTYEVLEDSKTKGHTLRNEAPHENTLKDKAVIEKQECNVLQDNNIKNDTTTTTTNTNNINTNTNTNTNINTNINTNTISSTTNTTTTELNGLINKDESAYNESEIVDSPTISPKDQETNTDRNVDEKINKIKPLVFKDSFSEIDGIKEKVKNGQVNQPYAYVTIAYNNLTACNAIILANSLMFNNNKILYTNDEKNQKINTLYIPTVILLPGRVDPLLRSAIYMIFDEVITDVSDIRTSILEDRTLDVHEYKLHLWKLLTRYEKCLFLESSLLIVGVISDLFINYNELSACVDVLFPDFFDCSLFLFEPSLVTYEDLVHFFVHLDSKKHRCGFNEGIDEITLLNTYFAKKWNKLSCIYNYVYNESIYTQIPAYLRYGDAIRIINFGQMSISSLSINVKSIAPQPWHVIFDLLQSSTSGKVITKSAVNNYTLFYLTLFIKRLWPLLRKDIEPLLIDSFSYGGKDWSIFELIRVLSQRFNEEYENHLFNQQPNSFRRKKVSNAEIYEPIEETKIKDNEKEKLINSSNKLENNLEITEKISDKDDENPNDNVENSASSNSNGIYAWESGQIDWMGAHQSDRIIANLKNKIQ